MRFQRKFGILGWFWVIVVCLPVFLLPYVFAYTRHIHTYAVIMLILWAILGLLNILSLRFVYWELDSSSFRIHRLWHVKEIDWDNVTQIGNFHPNYISSNYLEIHYIRSAPRSNLGSITANPADRASFLAAMRRLAHQAKFDV
jgi:hypothetical protein